MTNPGVSHIDWLSLSLNFIFVVALLLLLFAGLRYVRKLPGFQQFLPDQKRLRLIETMSLGPRQKIVLIN